MLNDLKFEDDVVVEDKDVLTGARAKTVESGIYPVKIDLAYLDESSGGAKCLKVNFVEHPFGNFTVRQTYWLTSGKAKGQKNYYIDREGKKRPLPGMSQSDHLAIVATGKHIHELDAEKKTVKLYSFEQKKEVPTEVNVITDLVGQVIEAGIVKKIENKNIQSSTGEWVPGPDKREYNEVDKVFNEAGLTATEFNAGEKEPAFKEKWLEKFENVTLDTFDANVAPKPAVPADAKVTEALFN